MKLRIWEPRKLKEEYPGNIQISYHDLEFILSISIEERRAKATDFLPIITTKEQQEEMEKWMKKNNINQWLTAYSNNVSQAFHVFLRGTFFEKKDKTLN
jgi:hypothetical protein